MKKVFLSVILCLLSFFGFSQNGGQFFQNNVIRIEYIGYNAGTHVFKVVNKQNCKVIIRTKADQDPAIDITVDADDSIYINVFRGNPGNVKFRVKAEVSCPNFMNPDMGWLELNTSQFTLPLVEGNIIKIIRGPNEYKVQLIGYVLQSDFGSLSEKETVVIHNMVGNTLEFRRIFVNRKNQIDLYPFMTKGLNLVTVFIDNKTKDIFTFKIFKY